MTASALALLWAAAGTACAKSASISAPEPDTRVRVVRSFPHDPRAFTQGLLLFDGKLYESTGLYGRSSLRRVDLESGAVERKVDLPPALFGEGLARVGDRLFQLTWQNGRVLVWNLHTLRKEAEMAYEGEGWGLCFDGKHLVMSDGTDRLAVRDPNTFAKLGEIAVRRRGRPVASLNELECVAGAVYANVWQDHHIARIDRRTGEVMVWIDMHGLLPPDEARGADVLNGIAVLPSTGNLLVTGKLWPRVLEVEILPAGSGLGPR